MKVKHLLYRQHVTLEHDTHLHLVSGLGYPCSTTCLSGFGRSTFASHVTILLCHDDPRSNVEPNAATLWSHVADVQEKSYMQSIYYTLSNSLLQSMILLISFHFIHLLMLMMGESSWPSFDRSLPVDFNPLSRKMM